MLAAWFLFLFLFLSYNIGTTFSAQISATTDAASPTVTAHWTLEEGDPQSFLIQLISVSIGQLVGCSDIRDAQPLSTGTEELFAPFPGTYRVKMASSDTNNFASSAEFEVGEIRGPAMCEACSSSDQSPASSSFLHAQTPASTTLNATPTTSITPSTALPISSASSSPERSTTPPRTSTDVNARQSLKDIIGGVIGGVAAVFTVLTVVIIFIQRKRRLLGRSHVQSDDGILTPYPTYFVAPNRPSSVTAAGLSRLRRPRLKQLRDRFMPTSIAQSARLQIHTPGGEARLHLDSGVRLPPPVENEVVEVPPVYTEA